MPSLSAAIVERGSTEHYAYMSTARTHIVICLAGLTACGKSTAARRLAKKYNLKYVSGGTALKELALKAGIADAEKGWWETPHGMRFLKQRQQNPRFDKQVDDRLLSFAKQGNVVLDSWTMPWLSEKGFKIWLEVSQEERARRLTRRDGISLEEAEEMIREKDGKTKQIYRKLYGFKLGEDYSPFDVVLDTELLSSEEVFDTLSLIIDRLVLRHGR
jgi:cytidylate kinase